MFTVEPPAGGVVATLAEAPPPWSSGAGLGHSTRACCCVFGRETWHRLYEFEWVLGGGRGGSALACDVTVLVSSSACFRGSFSRKRGTLRGSFTGYNWNRVLRQTLTLEGRALILKPPPACATPPHPAPSFSPPPPPLARHSLAVIKEGAPLFNLCACG